MQLLTPLERTLRAQRRIDLPRNFVSSCPPIPAETAMASVRWERRGVLGRLVRLDDPAVGGR